MTREERRKETIETRQKILDVFNVEMTIAEAKKIIDCKDLYKKHILVLKRKKYLQERKVTNTSRSALYKTAKPIYVHERDIPPKITVKTSVGYVNGVLTVSADDYHHTRLARKETKTYVSGSTLSSYI